MVKGEPWMRVVRPRGSHRDGSKQETHTRRGFKKTDDVQLNASGNNLDDGEFGMQLVSA